MKLSCAGPIRDGNIDDPTRYGSHLVAALGINWAHAVTIRLVLEAKSGLFDTLYILAYKEGAHAMKPILSALAKFVILLLLYLLVVGYLTILVLSILALMMFFYLKLSFYMFYTYTCLRPS